MRKRGRQVKHHFYFGKEGPTVPIALRLYGKTSESVLRYSRAHGVTQAELMRALIECIALPIVEADPTVLEDLFRHA